MTAGTHPAIEEVLASQREFLVARQDRLVEILREHGCDEEDGTVGQALFGHLTSDAPTCALCEAAPGVIDALWDDQPVKVCAPCFEFETGEASS